MSTIDREVDLSTEEREICEAVHRFAAEVMRPIGRQLDALHDPAEVSAPDSPLWEVFEKYRSLGIDPTTMAAADFTIEQQSRLRCLISEEMGWGDAGLAISLGVSGFPRMMAMLSGNPELIEKFGAEDSIGCWPITEPDHGSDLIYYGGHLQDAPGKPNCIAVKDGDDWIIKGQKAAWVSNGTIATAASLFCAVDTGDGPGDMGGFLISLDEPGVRRGKPLDKLGQRALNQGEIFFDDVRIPGYSLIFDPASSEFAHDMVLCQANGGMGSTFVGTAQAAYELGLEYAKERQQGGGPIIRHQAVKLTLFEMYRKVEAARALNRRVIYQNSVLMPPKIQMAVASKVTSTQAAFEVASSALQLHGGNGLSREYEIEKVMRDARASLIEDGTNEILSIAAAERL